MAMLAAAGALSVVSGTAPASATERKLAIYNIHTKETLEVVYKRDGEYVPEAMAKINHIMRDWRRDEEIEMDPALVDLIWELHQELGSKEPVYLISGYRSRKTNERLRRAGGGQARYSRHILGKAADIHFPDVSVKRLRNSALVRERGGVGYYPTSAIPFVHVDTGRVRHWPRLPRQELALLFPDAHTQHVPRDGRPITPKDVKVALATLHERGGELPPAAKHRLKMKNVPRPLLASLGPISLDLGLGRSERTRNPDKAEAPAPSEAVASKDELLEQVSPGDVRTASLQRDKAVPEAKVAAAPEYDEEHPDELYYQPFPILPLMTDIGLAQVDFGSETANLLKKVHLLFGEPRGSLPLQFEAGLQYAQLYWASQFKGRAVSKILMKRSAKQDKLKPLRSASTIR